jgi:CheY-like chemotaxis protein
MSRFERFACPQPAIGYHFHSEVVDRGPTVLIVEDDPDLRELLGDVVALEGYQVFAATNGSEALHYLRVAERPPCIILLDLMMPVMTGWEVLANLSREPALRTIPVVVLTAALNPSLPAGTRWFQKPPPFPELLAEICRSCG